ncbi:hypothetical protein AA12467_2198 [Gluconobacter sphaericus NBRC 12467]|nr:hypothetical protein AA12467_2198 [Gluconobacter sphaericus NBRC 12467]
MEAGKGQVFDAGGDAHRVGDLPETVEMKRKRSGPQRGRSRGADSENGCAGGGFPLLRASHRHPWRSVLSEIQYAGA